MFGSGHRWLGLLVGALVLGAGVAAAQSVIPPGQEGRVLALFEPHGFGAAPVEGWRLETVRIERSFIRATVAGPTETATLRLYHPEVSPSEERTASFAIQREGPSEAATKALDPWVMAIRANDDGTFWAGMATEVDDHRTGSSSRADPAPSPLADFVAFIAPEAAVPMAVLVLVLLVAFWERRRFGPDPRWPPPPSVGGRWKPWALAFALAVGVALALALLAPVPPLHPDTNRDLLLARDCLERGVCLGPSTSFGNVEQHAGWVRLLAFFRSLGLDPVGAHRVLIAAHAIAAGALALVAARRTKLWIAALVALLGFSWIMWAVEIPTLWNPTLAPLAYAILYAGVLARRWWVAGALAGLGAVAALETHVAGLVATAVVVLGLRVLADRPVRAVALALTLFVGLEGALSARSIALNLDAPIAPFALPAWVLGLGVSWLIGGWLRRRNAGHAHRSCAVLALAALGTVGPPLVALFVAGHFLSARYFAIAIVPVVGLLGAALAWLVRRGTPERVAAATLALLAIVSCRWPWSAISQGQFYDLEEVAVLADALGVRERYPSVRLALRGPLTNLLGEGFAVWAEDESFDPSLGQPSIRVVRVPSADALPAGWRSVDLPSGAVAGISERASWLDSARMEVCLTGEGPPECVTPTVADWRAFGGQRDTFERHASGLLPLAERLRERVAEGTVEPLSLFVRIPIRTDGSDPQRLLQLFDEPGGDGAWRVARIEGVAHRGELGGQTIVLVGGGEGTLTLEHTEPVEHMVPSLILEGLELNEAERPLLDVLCFYYAGC